MHKTLLAKHDHAAIEMCPCGTIHLSIGGLTMRLPAAAYEGLCETLVQGLVALKLEAETPGLARLSGTRGLT